MRHSILTSKDITDQIKLSVHLINCLSSAKTWGNWSKLRNFWNPKAFIWEKQCIGYISHVQDTVNPYETPWFVLLPHLAFFAVLFRALVSRGARSAKAYASQQREPRMMEAAEGWWGGVSWAEDKPWGLLDCETAQAELREPPTPSVWITCTRPLLSNNYVVQLKLVQCHISIIS